MADTITGHWFEISTQRLKAPAGITAATGPLVKSPRPTQRKTRNRIESLGFRIYRAMSVKIKASQRLRMESAVAAREITSIPSDVDKAKATKTPRVGF